MRVQLETPVSALEIPINPDHSWRLLASLIHARLYEQCANNQYRSNIIEYIQGINRDLYAMQLSSTFTWTDNQQVDSAEIARVLSRGQAKLGVRLFEAITIPSRKTLIIKMRRNRPLDKELLSSPLFTVTPQCRNIDLRNLQNNQSTCGLFRVIDKQKNGEMWLLEARAASRYESLPTCIELISLPPANDPLELLRSGFIDISATLGLSATQLNQSSSENTLSNRIVNLGMTLRHLPHGNSNNESFFSQEISDNLDRNLISAAMGGTYIPMEKIDSLFSSRFSHRPEKTLKTLDGIKRSPSTITIHYVDFHPNSLAAQECARQIKINFGIPVKINSINYSNYLLGACELDSGFNLILEIIQPVLPRFYYENFEHIPVAQACSTTISFNTRLGTRDLITKEALIDWWVISNNA